MLRKRRIESNGSAVTDAATPLPVPGKQRIERTSTQTSKQPLLNALLNMLICCNTIPEVGTHSAMLRGTHAIATPGRDVAGAKENELLVVKSQGIQHYITMIMECHDPLRAKTVDGNTALQKPVCCLAYDARLVGPHQHCCRSRRLEMDLCINLMYIWRRFIHPAAEMCVKGCPCPASKGTIARHFVKMKCDRCKPNSK